jgi:CBS domain containing-hemolysin-like protein
MRTLNIYNVEDTDELAWPEVDSRLSRNSPSIAFFTDFSRHRPLVINSTVTALEAERLMKTAHVRLKFVVNEENRFLGIVSLDDLNSQEIIKQISRDTKRDELSIKDFMRPRAKLKAIDYKQLPNARIGDVIEVLKESGEQHCLVVDRAKHQIRGIFSSSDIARKLCLNIDIQSKSTFANIHG